MKQVKQGMTRRDVIGGVGAAALLTASSGRVFAQSKEVIKFATLLDFTKIYTFATVEYSQGQRDYISMINATGGIDGHPIEMIIRDHASEPQRGIAMYDEALADGAVFFDFLSTPVSLAMVPRVLKDKVPMISLFHGRGDSIVGQVFPYVFPAGAIYWSQAALIIQYIRDHDGGLKGKKIAHVHIDTPFGREPIEVLNILAEREGFTLQTFPYPAPGSEQASTWSSVRRSRPDKVLIWGAGPAQAVSARSAVSNGIALEDVYSVIWMTESDTLAIGRDEAVGINRFEAVSGGAETPVVQRIIENVVNKGAGSGEKSKVGSTYYNMGVVSMALPVQGARLAMQEFGGPLTGEKLKAGLEMIKDFNAEGLMPPITLTAEDHQGGGWGRISRWTGTAWEPISDWDHAYQDDVIWPLARESAAKFKADNT